MKRRIPPTRQQLEMSRAAFAPAGHFQKAITDGVDFIASEMERKWGIGRLRLLVNDDLRSRFDAQAEKFDAAIQSGQTDLLSVQAEGMKRAWQALDKAATAAGQQPLSAEVWEVKLPGSDKIVAVVRTTSEAHMVATPDRETWTLSEIAHLIDHASSIIADIKRTFPGAEITAIHGKANPPDEPFDWSKGDDIPF
ncbi:MAG: hypothetical protein L6Q57_03270 [Alphaproteobacteria bacterium]|nr:hypothetical protein [Alphaproteobacteria bacterium]